MEQKKQTNAQLLRRINRAIVHVERTKDTKEIYFDDKGLRLMYNEDWCVVGTNFHSHVFNRITGSGVSRPYLFVQRFVDIAIENNCVVKDENGNDLGYSYTKLMQTLKDKEDKKDYNLCWYIDLWFYNMFQPLYSVDETPISATLVYEQYIHNIACNSILLEEHKENMTNKQFIDKICELVKEFTNGMNEDVIFHKMTDDELVSAIEKDDLETNLTEDKEDESKVQEIES